MCVCVCVCVFWRFLPVPVRSLPNVPSRSYLSPDRPHEAVSVVAEQITCACGVYVSGLIVVGL